MLPTNERAQMSSERHHRVVVTVTITTVLDATEHRKQQTRLDIAPARGFATFASECGHDSVGDVMLVAAQGSFQCQNATVDSCVLACRGVQVGFGVSVDALCSVLDSS